MKQITSPGWMHETSAEGWCTGKTQRDGMEREAGGGSGRGTHVNPWLIHVNVWQKPLQYCKVISLQLIKINGEKKKKKLKSIYSSEVWKAWVGTPALPLFTGWLRKYHLASLNFCSLICEREIIILPVPHRDAVKIKCKHVWKAHAWCLEHKTNAQGSYRCHLPHLWGRASVCSA